MTECRWRSSVDECQRRKFSAKNPEDMLKLRSVASMGLPKYLLIFQASVLEQQFVEKRNAGENDYCKSVL